MPATEAEQQTIAALHRNDATLRRPGEILIVAMQLALVLLIVYLFDIEGRRYFYPVMCIVAGGFLVHACLPLRFRLPFFAGLSVASILFVLGLENGACVIGVGCALIVIGCLPVRLRYRVLLLFPAAAGLALLRGSSTRAFWPVLGSMFMFRLILFLYDRRKETARPPIAETLAYFFMLPNVCFPLFPVVDYSTFRETYYDTEHREIYQTGIRWIVRGITHLLAYRLAITYLMPPPHELDDVPHILLFMAATYALYLRVSGLFHIITGTLHLFGFNLPRTHNLFFLASSFTDIWRRINIYWKDFMSKVFFFPAFFAIRGRGATSRTAILGGVFVVFLATWLLHAWQVFWLLGRFTPRGGLLWLSAGLLVAVNALRDFRKASQPVPTNDQPWLWRAASRSVRTIATFALVSFFWTCWAVPEFVRGLRDAPLIEWTTFHDLMVLLGGIAVAVAVGIGIQAIVKWVPSSAFGIRRFNFQERVALQTLALGAIAVVGLPEFGNLFDRRTAVALRDFRTDTVSQIEANRQMQGYYERLNGIPTQAGPLLSLMAGGRADNTDFGEDYSHITQPAHPWLDTELKPNLRGVLAGSRFSTNRFGMRDKDSLTLHKPPDTIRIAIVGSSIPMGYGVTGDEVFVRLLERRLNTELAAGNRRYETLNFGVGRYTAIQRQVQLDRKVLRFQPDAVYYIAHQDELPGPPKFLGKLLATGQPLPDPCLREIADEAGITSGTTWGQIEARLRPRAAAILAGIYRSFVDTCRTKGVIPVWMYLPMPGVAIAPDNAEELLEIARDAGFMVIDLTGWWQGHRPAEIKVPGSEFHPNALGHKLLADALFDHLRAKPGAVPK